MLDRVQEALDFSVSDLTLATFAIVLVLVLLEAILSADNAIALASLVRSLGNPDQEKLALRFGLLGAFVLRIVLILVATWVIRYWQFQLAGALYLLWLGGKFFWEKSQQEEDTAPIQMAQKLWQVVVLIAFTDLAFSLDSVTAAVAVARDTWLVLVGGVMGILALQFLANLFIKWIAEYTHLESAGYVIVLIVGARLLLRVVNEELVPPEWAVLSLIGLVFVWGFSKRNPEVVERHELS
ncbi:MAG: TerC family protein [Pseudanabaenaceae cyanobacterium]